MECGDLSPLWPPRRVAAVHSGDQSPHSKGIRLSHHRKIYSKKKFTGMV
jgi:hypothetical protein